MNIRVKPTAVGTHIRSSHEIDAMQMLAENQLRRVSVRVTKARIKVLAALLGANRAFSHLEVQDTFTDMDRVTLYRALDCLTEAGLAHKIAGDDRVFRYSAGTDHTERGNLQQAQFQAMPHQHGHFKCTRCAKVFCLDKNSVARSSIAISAKATERQLSLRKQLQAELEKTLKEGFQSHDIELTIKGWCADCGH